MNRNKNVPPFPVPPDSILQVVEEIIETNQQILSSSKYRRRKRNNIKKNNGETSKNTGNEGNTKNKHNLVHLNHDLSSSSSRSNVVLNKEINLKHSEEKHKKTRRKIRGKTPKIDPEPSTSKVSDGNIPRTPFKYIIKSMHNPSGIFIKKRNKNYKYVNLKSFLVNRSPPITFISVPRNISNDLTPKKTQKKTKLYTKNNKNTVGNVSTSFGELSLSQKSPQKRAESEKKRSRQKKPKIEKKFPEYLSEEDVSKGLSTGEFIKGFVRINPKNPRDSYVSNDNSTMSDYYINSVVDRNRALEGDEVVLKVNPENQWSDGKKTAVVVRILKTIHPRIAVGALSKIENDTEFAKFLPRDKRIPPIKIPSIGWPNGFKVDPKLYENVLFVARIQEWDNPEYAVGVITELLGASGDLKVETAAILREFSLNTTPFPRDVTDYLPTSKVIPDEEIAYREDIRHECVFTIDPLTARDLDDAVSVKKLPNGHYEVGVHISDASFYLEQGTELDQLVSQKATTVYLVDNVYHMLPVELCLHCSLLPGEDKLAFSVFWEMDAGGEVFDTRFTRTVLNSCAQLAYEHAQMMIDDPDRQFTENELPNIHNGFTAANLTSTVNVLQNIAVNLRQRRVQQGALRIDQVKLLFSLNPTTGEPLDFRIYESKEAHRLIEEFMLLANISVATKIHEAFPQLAFLRCHDPPKQVMLANLRNCLASCGIHLDVSSSGGINASIRKYITDDFAGVCRGVVLNHLLAKPMTRARYFCSSSVDSDEDFNHYALSVPIYTHFTSPIRRYADIMVHRLLAASVGYVEAPEWDVDYVCAIAANCNAMKYNAKKAGEASSDLYLAHYIEQHQPYIENCVVVDVKERCFEAIVLNTGSTVRVYPHTCQDRPKWSVEAVPNVKLNDDTERKNEKRNLKLTLTYPKTTRFPKSTIILEIFTSVKVMLTRKPDQYKLEATLIRPVS